MRSRFSIFLFVGVLFGFSGLAISQDTPNWQVASTHIADTFFLGGGEVDDSGTYIARYNRSAEVLNTNDLSTQADTYEYYGLRIYPWFKNTVVYAPVKWGAEPWPCPDSAAITLGRYNGNTGNFEHFCFSDVPEAFDVHTFSLGVGRIAYVPASEDLLLADERFLIDLQKGTVTDLLPVLSAHLDRNQIGSWVARQYVFWDPQTWISGVFLEIMK